MDPYDEELPARRAEAGSDRKGAGGGRLSLAMLVMVIAASLLLLGVGLIPTSWATPVQNSGPDSNFSIPTRTPVPMTMTLAVALQRPNSPPPSAPWAVPVILSFYPPGDAVNVAGQWNLTLDQNGHWTGPLNLFPGNYDVRTKNPHTLRNVKRNVAVAQDVAISMGTLLEGDADNDNRVRASDFAILRATYFKNSGDPGFDPRADFDEDKRVRSSDFALLRSNYFATGDIEVVAASAQASLAGPRGTVAVALEPPELVVRPGEIFTLTLMAHAGGQEFVALDAEILFPAANLQVVGADGLPALTIEPLQPLQPIFNQVNNAGGEILYAAGVPFGEPAVSGDVPVASLRFKVLQVAARMPITMLDVTVADASGKWVTGPVTGTIVSAAETPVRVYLPVVFKGG